jgi:transposase-like protein
MIQTIDTHYCPTCGSKNLVRNGHDYKGAQKYHCKSCGRYGTLEARRGSSEQVRGQGKRAVLERASLRGIARILGLSRRTLARWIESWAACLPPLEETLAEAQVEDVLELDELWSFVLKKANQRWVWVALCRRTRQIVAYFIGDRSEASCLHLWRRIPRATRAATRSVISGRPTGAFLPPTGTKQWVKTVGKPIISSAGSTPCATAWLASCAKRCPFPSPISSMR